MNTSLQELAEAEPWRRNFGAPRNAMDPTWVPSVYDMRCDGDIEFESTWWCCKRCGFVGSSSTTIHRPPYHPVPFFLHSLLFFMGTYRKRDKAPNLQLAVHQMLYTAGVALRYAAVQRPGQLGPYLDRMVTT